MREMLEWACVLCAKERVMEQMMRVQRLKPRRSLPHFFYLHVLPEASSPS
jgi:hypothetical protein